MKNLIIAGTFYTKNTVITYNVSIYGQTAEHPVCIYITDLEITTEIGHSVLEDICREKYAAYFGTDLYNIISLNKLIDLGEKALTN